MFPRRLLAALLLTIMMMLWPSRGRAAQDGQPPTVAFGATTVTISNVVPNGRVAIFAVAREPHRYYSKITRRAEILTDSSGSGQVVLTIPTGVPNRAIWGIVDLTTGRYVVQPTSGYENTPKEITDDILKNDNNGQLRKLEMPFSEVNVCWIRPGAGAWWGQAGKDSEIDENKGQPYGIRLDIRHMLPVGNTSATPNNFRKGDILVFIDPRWMTYAFLEVGQ